MATPRPEIRYQRVRETRGEEEEEDEVTVYLYSHPPSPIVQEHYRGTCVRIFSSILLLMVAAGFVFYDFEFGNADTLATPQRLMSNLDEMNLTGGPQPLPEHEEPGEGHHHHHHDSQTSDHGEEDEEHEDHGEEDEEHEDHGEEDEEHEDHGEEEGDGHQDGNSSSHHHHSEGTFHQSVAVTDSETCSMMARDVLQSGGSVVDAGVSAALCLVVVHPHTSSLGGIFSSIYFSKASQSSSVLHAIPIEDSPVLYGVPQVLQGLWTLHQKYGKKPWAELVTSAVILAHEGFLVDSSLHTALVAHHEKVQSSEGLRSLFCDPHQNLKNVGERVQNPTLGNLLEQVAGSVWGSGLPNDFIHNLMTDMEVTEMEKFTELFSRPPTIEDPLTLHLETLTMFTTGGPTAGKILSNSIQKIYNEKLQPDLVSELLLNSSQTMYVRGGAWPRNLSSVFSPLELPPWNVAPVGSNVMIVDSDGDILVMSLTLNSTFGSGFVSPSTGILLSDFIQGHQGSTQSSSPLYWACPSVLMYGPDNDVMALSAYGGSSVPFSMVQVVVSHLLLDMDLTDSVAGSLVEVSPGSSDPWMKYFGLLDNDTEPVVAVEVQAEHVHVKKSHGPCCYPAGL